MSGPNTLYDLHELPTSGPKVKKVCPSKHALAENQKIVHCEVMRMAQGYVALIDAFPDRDADIESLFVLKMFTNGIDGLISATTRRHGERQIYKDIRLEYFEGNPQFKKTFDKLVSLSFVLLASVFTVHPLIHHIHIIDQGGMCQPQNLNASWGIGCCPFRS